MALTPSSRAHRVAAVARRILPGVAFRWLRSLGTAALTPASFSVKTGHFKSAILSRAVDCHGEPIPWYTYPAIDFLSTQRFETRAVLEWGAGQSTVWWSRRALSVTSYEADSAWYRKLSALRLSNVSLHLVDEQLRDAQAILDSRRFDVVAIDGLDRAICARASVSRVTDDGAIILDDSEGYWGEDGTYPILDLLRNEGFRRVDFCGYAPGVVLPHCTSIFFRGDCFLFCGQQPPVRLYRNSRVQR